MYVSAYTCVCVYARAYVCISDKVLKKYVGYIYRIDYGQK